LRIESSRVEAAKSNII